MDSARAIADSVPPPGRIDSLDSPGETGTFSTEPLDPSGRKEAADSMVPSAAPDSVLEDADTVSAVRTAVDQAAMQDSAMDADTAASGVSKDRLDSLAVPQAELVTDTIFNKPQSDNPLALRYNGIYISGATASVEGKIDGFIDSIRGTVIGGFVIDMKDDQGRLSYVSKLPLAAEIGANTRRLKDPESLVGRIHANGLIACARVVAFKDPKLAGYFAGDSTYPYAVLDSATDAPWEQANGELWANPYHEKVHDYLLGVIEELAEFGFDQVQLDYTRFPTDGQVNQCKYPVTIDSLNRADVVGLFLSKVRKKLERQSVSLAVDVFGWVPWLNKNRNYWIGQDYDIIASYADVICPMLYSSHFPDEFKAEYEEKRAYCIVREGTLKGVLRRGERSTGVQPYIQGFKWRAPYFGSRYLLDQMQAAGESGAVGWIVWNAANNYSALWQALRDQKMIEGAL